MTQPRLDVDVFAPSVLADPFPVYRELAEVGPVVWNEVVHGWMVVGFDDCATVLTDDGARFGAVPADPAVLPWFEAPSMISLDGVDHTRLRGALAPMFSRRQIARWEQRVEAVVDDILVPTLGTGAPLPLHELTMVPTIVVAEMLGVPAEHHQDFRRWSTVIANHLAWGHESEDDRRLLLQASHELNAYLRDEIARHRRQRPDDLFTAMIDAAGGGAMDDDELRAAAVLLMVAGYETTAKLLGNVLVTLQEHPDQRRVVAKDPRLVPPAIEEVLRWRGTVQAIPRVVVAEGTLAGVELAAGQLVYALVGAAGRDPRRWEDPDRFDVRREPRSHFGFGWGPHLCLGAPLARLEAKVAIERVLAHSPSYELDAVTLGPSFFIRGPEAGWLRPQGAPVGATQP